MAKGLPAYIMKMKGMTLKQKWAFYKKKKKGGKSAPKKKSTGGKSMASNSPAPRKKMTVSKGLDIGAVGIQGAFRIGQVMDGKDIRTAAEDALACYSSFNLRDGSVRPSLLVNGWGAVGNRIIEKKLNRFLSVRGPRTCVKNFGDVLDHATYWASTAIDVSNETTKAGMVNAVARNQYGMDLTQPGWASWQPMHMIKYKLGPYYFQKLLRKGMRAVGMQMPNFKFS